MFRFTLFSLCIAVGVLNLGWCANSPAGKNVQNQTLAVVERIWMSQVFDQARQHFDMTANQSAQCRRDYDLYQLHFRNQSIWAVRMLEASEWPEIGIFAGMTYHMGNWAECVNIKSYGITGQFCLPKATYDYIPDKVNFTIEEVPAEESSAWTAMKMYMHNPIRVNRHEQSWAMCIPSSCTPADLEASLNETVDSVFKKYGFNVTFDVDPVHCSTREVPIPYKITPIVKAFFIILILMLFGATTFDFIESRYKDVENDDNEPVMKEFISAFSIRKNTIQLFTARPSDNPPIHFGKIIAMFFIIFGHLFLYTFSYPLYNPEYIENEYRKWNIALTRTSIVDLFFGISGILTCYHSMESVKKGGIVYLIAAMIVRYLRMVPIFGVLMLFVIYFLPHMGNGPYWKDRILREVDHCSSSWWTNFLVVNNFVQPEKQCLIISWYIAVDIQLSIIGCILLYMVVKNRTLGWIMIGLVFFIGNAATFAAVYINKYYGLTRLFISFQKEPRWHDEFNYFYIHPHPRIAPYIVGFAAALLAFEFRESKYIMSKTKSRVIFLLLLAISEGSQWYGIIFYKFGRKYDIIENSIYGALNRWLFLLPYAFLCVQYFTTGLEPIIDKLINHKIYVPFGRLTYSVFLVNSVIELYLSSMQADLMASSTPANMWVWTVGAVFYSYFIGFIFYVCIEAPFVNQTKLLQRVVLGAVLPKKRPAETGTELPEKKQIEN